MTDNDIVKALEYCGCAECMAIIDLINRQKAEIEGMKESERILICQLAEERGKAIKEFAERLKSTPCRFREEKTTSWDKPPITKMVLFVDDNDIDNLVKEMTEETK